MSEIRKNGETSVRLRITLYDSASPTGGGLTGLTFSTTGLIISTICENEATAATYTAAASNIETITTLGTYAAPSLTTKCRFKEVDPTNHPGLYELQLDNTRFAVSGAKQLKITFTAPGMVQQDYTVELLAVDLYDTVRAGLTALPNAVAAASGGLPTVGTGSGQITLASGLVTANVTQYNGVAATSSGGRPEVNTTHLAGTSQTARDIGASVLLSSGTGTGQISLTSGGVSVSSGGITSASFANGAITASSIATDAIGSNELATSAITEIQTGLATSAEVTTVGSNVTAIKTKTDFLPSATAGASGGLFIAGTNAATTITGSLTTTFTGNLTGSVGSITTGGIAAASFAAGAITESAFAADAITDAKVASDVTVKISSGTGTGQLNLSSGVVQAALTATGLDAISIADPGQTLPTTFSKYLLVTCRRFLAPNKMYSDRIDMLGDDGVTVNLTQVLSDSGGIQSVGEIAAGI